jgi:hypothetical protein
VTTFDAMVDSLGGREQVTIDEAKIIANFVNVASGRARLPGQFDQALVTLAVPFFAPRFALSRFYLGIGQPLFHHILTGKGTWRVRRLILKQYVKGFRTAAIFYGTVAIAAALLYDDDDEDKPRIELDMRSSDFGKIILRNTRLDPLAGLSQTAVFMTKMLGDEEKDLDTGRVKNLSSYDKGQKLSNFLRTKFSPSLALFWDVAVAKEGFGGEPLDAKYFAQQTVPLTYRDVLRLMKDQGIPTATALMLLSIFGAGLQVYDSPYEKAKAAKLKAWKAKHKR